MKHLDVDTSDELIYQSPKDKGFTIQYWPEWEARIMRGCTHVRVVFYSGPVSIAIDAPRHANRDALIRWVRYIGPKLLFSNKKGK